MRRAMLVLSFILAFGCPLTSAAEARAGDKSERRPYGIEKRVPWTTSRVVGTPDPPSPYRTAVAFPKLKFSEPLELTSTPGVDRLFVAERHGKLFSFAEDPKSAKAELLLDVGKTVYGLALHPRFAENGYFYVTYVLDPLLTQDRGTRLARFTAGDRLHADPASEFLILEWPSGGHNGGCLTFGPDGYLYIVTGDGSGIADELQSGQNVGDLLASILRIDVDHPGKGTAYGIPADNPFVGVAGARPEIWAYGLRQSWKINFDRATGNLWAGEVGQDLWESVHLIRRGGNYGWSVMEATHPFRPERPRGPSPIIPPVFEHPHVYFRSLTGGFVYHGKRLPELAEAYIYGDYDTGKIAALRYDGEKVTSQRELADTTLRIIDFGEDSAGELYLMDFIGGTLHRLEPTPKSEPTPDFPRKLSETGLFSSTKDHVPAPGLIPYSVNAALWSDHATKERFIAVPGDAKIEYDTVLYPQPAPGAPPGWRFPTGTVIVKTFSLEMERGNPASRRRLETRLLHCELIPGTEEVGDQVWRGYTYVWNDEQTDAVLADTAGLDRTFTIRDAAAEGGERQQAWHFPSRAECTLCHTMPAKYVLGLNTLQMNKDHDYGGVVANQLQTLEHLGMFTQWLPALPDELPRLADYQDEAAPLDRRARAYLHANCAHCHMKWGGGNAEFQLLTTLNLKDLGIVDTRPGHGMFEAPDARVLVPGEPDRSLVYLRMKRLGLGRMPHVASTVVDESAVKLIREWIEQMPE